MNVQPTHPLLDSTLALFGALNVHTLPDSLYHRRGARALYVRALDQGPTTTATVPHPSAHAALSFAQHRAAAQQAVDTLQATYPPPADMVWQLSVLNSGVLMLEHVCTIGPNATLLAYGAHDAINTHLHSLADAHTHT